MPQRRTILLVEDEELVRNYLRDFLRKNAWTVSAVSSGNEALARLAEFEFDIILCDLDLGRGPNGLDVLSRMPTRNEKTPFVILTAHGSTGRCREAFLRGAMDFLEKPVHREALLAALDHAISGTASESPIDVHSPDDILRLPHDEAGAAHVRSAIQIMEARYTEFDLTVTKIAQKARVSPDHLARVFRARLGCSPLEHLHQIRIAHAEVLIRNPALSMYEIALECGYRRTSEFGSWFRRLRGAPPSSSRTA